MKLMQRLGFYFAGLSIGILIIAFIWKEKRTDFCYFPGCRVLKNIRTKQLVYSQNVIDIIKNSPIDSLTISEILKFGNVNFDKGNRDLDSCKIYVIESVVKNKGISLTIENCEKTATINSISLE